ncbi:hypothetical protein GGR56DRAFT_188773 [Xylariaceae sp. FL0804]|nr:hypothetical protein GGR56DRAFT_188773 [Xylariaceae sp. FL0804]
MPPHLHPRSRMTSSLFATTVAVSFFAVALPHVLPCPAPRVAFADSELNPDGTTRRRRRRRPPQQTQTQQEMEQEQEQQPQPQRRRRRNQEDEEEEGAAAADAAGTTTEAGIPPPPPNRVEQFGSRSEDFERLRDGVARSRGRGRERECPVPKPGGVIGELMGFSSKAGPSSGPQQTSPPLSRRIGAKIDDDGGGGKEARK